MGLDREKVHHYSTSFTYQLRKTLTFSLTTLLFVLAEIIHLVGAALQMNGRLSFHIEIKDDIYLDYSSTHMMLQHKDTEKC